MKCRNCGCRIGHRRTLCEPCQSSISVSRFSRDWEEAALAEEYAKAMAPLSNEERAQRIKYLEEREKERNFLSNSISVVHLTPNGRDWWVQAKVEGHSGPEVARTLGEHLEAKVIVHDGRKQ